MASPAKQRAQTLRKVRRRPRGSEVQPPGPSRRLPESTKARFSRGQR